MRYLAASAVTMALDLLWLGVLAKDLYRAKLGHLMAPQVRWGAALLFYALYGFGVVYFTASPASTLKDALVRGALLGLLVYGTYDLTNMAVLRDWGGTIAAVDVAWGIFLTALASAAAFKTG